MVLDVVCVVVVIIVAGGLIVVCRSNRSHLVLTFYLLV
jgi:hypothetical protein